MRFPHRHPFVIPLLAIVVISIAMTQRASAATFSSGSTIGISRPSTMKVAVQARLNARKAALATKNTIRMSARMRASLRRQAALRSAAPILSSSSVSGESDIISATTDTEMVMEVFTLVNEERLKHGMAPYTYNVTLARSATEYAAHMETVDCFSHDECGSILKERMHASGYYAGGSKSYSYGENIARGQDTAQEVMADWMNSRSHKAAILSSKYLEIGIGKSGDYWVQHFGAVR